MPYFNYAVLENCKRNINDLNCNIQKNKLEEILTLSGEKFTVGTMNDNEGLFQFDFVFNIIITYYDVKKVDLFIGLTQIIGGITEIGIPFGIETNITSIPNFISKEFTLMDNSCYFKKTTGRPLILFYDNHHETEDIFNITISKEIIINNAHYKYNFRIQPCEINQNISIRGRGNDINLIFPEKLDFSPDEESLIIRYIKSSNDYLNNIKLNPNSTDLQCNDLNGMIKCAVSYFHFMGEKSGFYNTYHLNHEKEYIINYNIPPINVPPINMPPFGFNQFQNPQMFFNFQSL